MCDEIERIARQFIWGSTNGHPKLALVGRDFLCQPRSQGVLGLIKLHDQNNSLMMKLGFNLVTKTDALWVRVLRLKYGMKEQLPNSITKSQCSHLWRALSKAWPFLCENLTWLVGNGTSFRCWKDSWILKIDSLLPLIHASANLNLDCLITHMVLNDGAWNLDLFRVLLTEEVNQQIVSIPPPHPKFRVDRVIWAASNSGSFPIRSAYWSLKQNSWDPMASFWKNI